MQARPPFPEPSASSSNEFTSHGWGGVQHGGGVYHGGGGQGSSVHHGGGGQGGVYNGGGGQATGGGHVSGGGYVFNPSARCLTLIISLLSTLYTYV